LADGVEGGSRHWTESGEQLHDPSGRFGAAFILVGIVWNWRQLGFAMSPNIAAAGNQSSVQISLPKRETIGSSLPSM